MPAFAILPALLAAFVVPVTAHSLEVAVSYFALPGEYDFVQKDLSAGTSDQMNSTLSFNLLGLRVQQDFWNPADKIGLGFEAGFGAPLGGQTWDARTARISPAPASTRNDTNDGDYSQWSVFALPLMATWRLIPRGNNISFAAHAGAGPVLLSAWQDNVDTTYDAIGTYTGKTTSHRRIWGTAVGVEMFGGLSVPAAQGFAVRLMAGFTWLSSVERLTTVSNSPLVVSGFRLGGMDLSVRAGLALDQ